VAEEVIMSELFGYSCPECGQGLVQEQHVVGYVTRVDGEPSLIPEAVLGVCVTCGAQIFDPTETIRWREQAVVLRDEPEACAFAPQRVCAETAGCTWGPLRRGAE
jgi:hypothetical protein